MVTAIIFFIHFIFAIYIFTKKWQEENITHAWMNMGLILILFSVGWTITGMFAKLIMEQNGFGVYFDRDTFSLALLTIIEFFFYKFYYTPTEGDKEKQ